MVPYEDTLATLKRYYKEGNMDQRREILRITKNSKELQYDLLHLEDTIDHNRM